MSNFDKLVISYKSKQGDVTEDFKISLEGTPTLLQLLDLFENVISKIGIEGVYLNYTRRSNQESQQEVDLLEQAEAYLPPHE
jgi:hypothetical protein